MGWKRENEGGGEEGEWKKGGKMIERRLVRYGWDFWGVLTERKCVVLKRFG